VKILKAGGFEDTGPAFIMTKVNIGNIDEAIESVAKFVKSNFNPYQEHVISHGLKMENYEGPSTVEFNKLLDDLEKERVKIMSQPIRERRIKVFKIEPQNFKEFDRQFQEERENNQDDEKYMDLENLKKILKKQGDEPKFTNRRMQEYQ
jgi:hypothetical protein